MVDNGVHDFKPFVHSDCGGDYRGTAGDLLRWTAHCTFGTILRFHGSDHRPWTYDEHTESIILSYLTIRYKLIPTFISAGQAAESAGYPLVVRGDLIWPDQSAASDNTQYIHLNETLVAPIWDSTNNQTTRSVWIPPGNWQDAWDGSMVSGPKSISVTLPYEKIPMWHRLGSFLITVDSKATRVEDQDWSVLTLEVFPDFTTEVYIEKSLYSLGTAARTDLSMANIPKDNNNGGFVNFHISASEDGESRGWLVRLHLRPGQNCISAGVDDDGTDLDIVHIDPITDTDDFFPFGGSGTPPAPKAGKIAEIKVPMANHERKLQLSIL
jgi:alpha-glucosidase (family GH31 glycosyl hydrolase)